MVKNNNENGVIQGFIGLKRLTIRHKTRIIKKYLILYGAQMYCAER